MGLWVLSNSILDLLACARSKFEKDQPIIGPPGNDIDLTWLTLYGIRELQLWEQLNDEFLGFLHNPVPQSIADVEPVSLLMVMSYEAYFRTQVGGNLQEELFRANLVDWFRNVGCAYYDLEPFFAKDPAAFVVERNEHMACGDILGASGVNLVGYANAVGGLGEDLRAIARAFTDCGVPFTIFCLPHRSDEPEQFSTIAELFGDCYRYPVSVYCLNAAETIRFWHIYGDMAFNRTFNIALLPWELSRCPKEAEKALELMDEIWAISRFNQELYQAAGHPNVLHMRPLVNEQIGADEVSFRAPRPFRFLNIVDARSYLSRKNIGAVVSAFRQAFPVCKNDQAELLIKITNANWHDTKLQAVLELARSDRRIRLISEGVSSEKLHHLYSSSDCYISLHRGEGFGRTVAEAMLYRKPVIATDWSGSTDLLSENNGFPVQYTLVPVEQDEYLFPDGQYWAEPDIDDAAQKMQEVYRMPVEKRVAIGEAARKFVVGRHSGHAAQKVYADRVREIGLTACH